MKQNGKLIKGMLVGAAVGAVVALFDRETREITTANMKECSKRLWNVAKDPAKVAENISGKIVAVKDKVEEVTEDVKYIVERVNDITNSTRNIANNDKDVIKN